jgi:hypothetical protein
MARQTRAAPDEPAMRGLGRIDADLQVLGRILVHTHQQLVGIASERPL